MIAEVDRGKAEFIISTGLDRFSRSQRDFLADRLDEEGLRPGKALEYHWWSVQDLLRSAVYHDRATAIGCAKDWKAQGKSLRDIAMKLMEDGHRPKRGGQWFAQQVKQLLVA